MRASESLGGKLAAARLAPDPERPERPAERALPHIDFLGDPKNLEGRSKSIAAALVREERQATAAPTRACRRGRPRRGRAARPRPRPRDACCGLDGINVRTGVICGERHSEILNRERVSSICGMDKHALDDYLNEGSSQEHEEELMQYFQRAGSGDTGPPDPHDKLSQLRRLLAENLKSQNGTSAPDVDSSQDQSTDSGSGASASFKPIAGPDRASALPENDGAQPSLDDRHRQTSAFDKRMQALAPNRMPGGPNCEFDEIPESPATRMQVYDFVPISPSRRSPSDSSASPVKRPTTDAGRTDSPLASAQASPFVSPRDTPVPRSRLHPKPLPDKLVKRKASCGAVALGSESCQRQISFAMPVDQKNVPKSPVYCGRARHDSRLPMSAPPSPNILTSRYKTQFHLAQIQTNGIGNGDGCHGVCYGISTRPVYHDGTNGDCAPHSADPLSSEVSQFFHEPVAYDGYRDEVALRSQSVPLRSSCKAAARPQYGYDATPAGSVPPTPVPHEFCDFESLDETCEAVSKAGLNSESLDKIYNVLDSHRQLDGVIEQQLNGVIEHQLNGVIEHELAFDAPLVGKDGFAPTGPEIGELLKRPSGIDLAEMDLGIDGKGRYAASRSVPSTPLPYAGVAGDRLERAQYATQPSKSVPSTPLLGDERGPAFGYSNRDFLINGHALGAEGGGAALGLLELHKPLEEPLGGAEELPEIDCMELPHLQTTDLLGDLDAPDHAYLA